MDETPKLMDHARPSELAGLARRLPDVTSQNFRSVWGLVGQHGAFSYLMSDQRDYRGCAEAFVEAMLSFGENCSDNGFAMAIISQILTVQNPLHQFASPDQKTTYLPRLLAGELLAAFALTEHEAGSDALSLKTRAEYADGGYLINGAKAYVGMGPICDLAIVFARTAPDKGRWGLSAFLVHADDEGFIRHPRQKKLGLNSAPFGQLEFNACWVPETRRLGPEGAGASIIQSTLDLERCFILSAQVGAMRRQLRECAEHAATRIQFGKPIAAFQSVSNRLADMRTRLETCRLMLRRAAQLYDTGQPLTQFAAMANLHISEALLNSGMDAMRLMGGQGYLAGSTAGSDVADAIGGVIYSGTSDIQREIISKMELHQARALRERPQ
ncbi:acyl-CoA dehydrogenase [Ruegeria sp. SCPT10]|uniref:acyl-CoA dehydrogenase family protein n=1 Tax=Ruegeria sp. SCP10 TaxID=3141377 RepID=UPI00333744F7